MQSIFSADPDTINLRRPSDLYQSVQSMSEDPDVLSRIPPLPASWDMLRDIMRLLAHKRNVHPRG